MRTLALLAEHGSIHDTAEICHLSAPAVHKHLKTLEQEFGAQLYEKRHGRLELTDAGRLLLPFVREILAQHEAAITTMQDWSSAKRGKVRIGAGPSFSSLLMPPLVKRFRRDFPGVDVFIETATGDQLVQRLRGGHLDLIFDLASLATEEPDVEVLAQWKSPGAFIARRSDVPSPCNIEQLRDIPFILYHKGTRIEKIVSAYLDQIGFHPRIVMRSDSAEATKAMIRAGLGISVLFLWNINSESRSSPLSVVRIKIPPLISYVALVAMKSHYLAPAVRQFIQLAKQTSWKNLHPV